MGSIKADNLVDEKCDVAVRIMDAAEFLFAEKGFDGASARDITSRAKCNVASINYYFQGKDNLYLQVCKRRLNFLRDFRVDSIHDYMAGDPAGRSLEGLLLAFSKAFLAPLIEEGSGPSVMKLMIREMLYPQLPANMMFEELIIPMVVAIQEALSEVCPGLSEENIHWSIHSLIAQLLHTVHVQGMVAGTTSDFAKGFDIDRAVTHIVAFTAGGIKSITN